MDAIGSALEAIAFWAFWAWVIWLWHKRIEAQRGREHTERMEKMKRP